MFTSLFTMLMLSFGCSKDDTKSDTGLSPEPSTEDTDSSDTEDTTVTDSANVDTEDTIDTAQDTSVDTDVVDTAVQDTGDTGTTTGPGPNAVADFVLPDINPASPTLGQNISPRDYLQQISGWYFIKAT